MGRATHLAVWLGFFGSVAALGVVSCTDSDENHPHDGGSSGSSDSGASGSTSGTSGGATSSGSTPGSLDGGSIIELTADETPAAGTYCSLPGSVVAVDRGRGVVPGADIASPDLTWVSVPPGFCAHHFANVAETRNLRVSPGGDLFVASPSTATAGGEQKTGVGAILVLPDDDHDGLADSQIQFLPNMASSQGMTFANGYFYFQDHEIIKRLPYAAGERTAPGNIETVTTISNTVAPQSADHWPKAVDVAQDGTVYVTNGSDQGETCRSTRTAIGAVFKAQPSGPSLVMQGFRNPIALRCESDHDVCLVAELAKDGSGGSGGREKLVPVQQGADWGFPCCATTNTPYTDQLFDNNQAVPDSFCAGVTPENVSFQIGHTPFGLDFEQGLLGDPWAHRVFVALHGYVGSYVGSRVVAVALDPTTGLPLQSTDVEGLSMMPNMLDFVVGWDDGHQDHGRATTVAFGNDGRLYVGDDTAGEIFWVAPVTLKRPQ
jgi:glucose/arabinose dehydrogenase